MAIGNGTNTPRTFFLNEQHELARGEKQGGGGQLKLAPINWQAKGNKLKRSLTTTKRTIRNSSDPLRDDRYFLATTPAPIKKLSKDRKKAPDGTWEEQTDYGGEHSKIFKRLGLDLLAVEKDGRALIHVPSSRFEQLVQTADNLSEEGPREQSRWISIDEFSPVSSDFRIDHEWIETFSSKDRIDSVVELQPLLTRVEVEKVISAIIHSLGKRASQERFTRMGTDFSGRFWYRGLLSLKSLRHISEQFYSVQALHPPLHTIIVGNSLPKMKKKKIKRKPVKKSITPVRATDPSMLPTVAVVDAGGVPENHNFLAPYIRSKYVNPNTPAGIFSDHPSRVASRIVFGDPDFATGVGATPPAECSFVDVNIAEDAEHIDDKAVLTALQAIVATSPDVRVFNLSFGSYRPLNSYKQVERREKLLLIQDLDNFAFRSDVIIIVAAGNSPPGISPTSAYPDHIDDPQWALGSWACGFNTLKCGSYVGRLSPGGLVENIGWPSPFTRIGPGLCDAPVPEFSANGGNCDDQYKWSPGLGVWNYNASSDCEDSIGSSYAAPLLSREAAFVLKELQQRCEQGARPFAATVKAFFALTAEPPVKAPKKVMSLIDRTLGRGTGKSERLHDPIQESSVLIWQGVLNDPDDKARIQVPIPQDWLKEASSPTLRIIAAWESPVNAAVENIWASRKIEFQLRPKPMGKALSAKGKNHKYYPILDRKYLLGGDELERKGVTLPDTDSWLLEVSYKEIAEYAATIEFSPHQRVGIAMELTDEAEEPVSPQDAMQALPQAVTMARLTVPENRIANPVVVKQKVSS